jgi:hypothetical protein
MSGGTCTQNSGAGILAFNNNAGKGSAAELAVFAMNKIYQFTSASGRTEAPVPPKGLSFSNTAGDATYGGDFGSANCIPDYYNAPIGNGYTVSSSLPSSPIGDSARRVVKVDGDLIIDNDLIFGNTNWASISSIPSLYVIVRGNIFIAPSVTKLDGVYIAQDDGSGSKGKIFTCTNAARTGVPAAAAEWSDCDDRLLVNGSFIAKTLRLLRLGESVSATSSDEGRQHSDSQAESFVYRPELFFHSPFTSSSGYESIMGLPPVL